MAKAGRLLGDGEALVLQDTVDTVRSWREAPPRSRETNNPESHQAPECYVALAPLAGIPALTVGDESSPYDKPGYATCPIYNVYDDEGVLKLVPTGYSELVLNVSLTVIPYSYVVINREKYGYWVASSSLADSVLGTGSGTGSGTGTGTTSGGTGTASDGTSSTSDCAVDNINGVSAFSLPVITPADVAYILVVGVDGCISLLPKSSC